MGITVKHTPSAGVIGQAANLAGAGDLSRFEKGRSDRFKLQQNEIVARETSQRNQIAAAERQQAQGYAQQENMARLQNQLQEERDFRMADIAEDSYDYKYTQKQNQHIEELQNAKDWVNNNSGLSDDQKAELLWQIEAKSAGITPGKFPKDPSKPDWPEGQGIGDSWTSELGNTISRDEKGNKFVLEEKKEDKSAEIQAKKQEALVKSQLSLIESESAIYTLAGKTIAEQIKSAEAENTRLAKAAEKDGVEFTPVPIDKQTIISDAYAPLIPLLDKIKSLRESLEQPPPEAQQSMAPAPRQNNMQVPQISRAQAAQLPVVNGPTAYNRLKPGQSFIGPDGNVRTKP
jgi:hypothetical protein